VNKKYCIVMWVGIQIYDTIVRYKEHNINYRRPMSPAPPIANLGSKPGAIVCVSLVHVSAFYPVVSASSLPK